LGFTQRQLAQAFGLTPLSQLHYEAGRTPFPTDLLPTLDDLGVDSAWVATGVASLGHAPTQKRFALALKRLRSEAETLGVLIDTEKEVEIAWLATTKALTSAQHEVVIHQTIAAALRKLSKAGSK